VLINAEAYALSYLKRQEMSAARNECLWRDGGRWQGSENCQGLKDLSSESKMSKCEEGSRSDCVTFKEN
jgi:hypothetical protein